VCDPTSGEARRPPAARPRPSREASPHNHQQGNGQQGVERVVDIRSLAY